MFVERASFMEKKILQIIPADGWLAVFTNEDKTRTKFPLVCWALVEDEHGQSVQGMYGGDYVEFCMEISNFSEYEHLSEPPYRLTGGGGA